MARTKRKTNPVIPAAEAPAQAQKQYRAAAYVRLSVEDSGKPGADTIEGQKNLLLRFIEDDPTLTLYGLFCDNGRTGTDFERPQFEKMMEEVRKGHIDCIVVKDLSRFGRNYKEAGNYLERIFPFLGVRFIAVNDGFGFVVAKGSNAGRRIGPDSRKLQKQFPIRGETAAVLLGDGFGAFVQFPGACVVSKPLPQKEHIIHRRGGQSGDIGKAGHEAFKIGAHGFDGCLLKHNFGNPDPIRIGMRAAFDPPGQVSSVFFIPIQQFFG